jgi:hypothetical protein
VELRAAELVTPPPSPSLAQDSALVQPDLALVNSAGYRLRALRKSARQAVEVLIHFKFATFLNSPAGLLLLSFLLPNPNWAGEFFMCQASALPG